MADSVNVPKTSPVAQFDVKDQTLPDTLFALMRITGVLISGIVALLGFVKTKDLAGMIAYVKSTDLLATGATALTLALAAYGTLKTYLNKRKLITAAAAAPDSVARVVTPGT